MAGGLTPEQQARQEIDRLLVAAGWAVQDYKTMNLAAGRGVAVREFPTPTGPMDYMLYVDRRGIESARPFSESSRRRIVDSKGFSQRVTEA